MRQGGFPETAATVKAIFAEAYPNDTSNKPKGTKGKKKSRKKKKK